MDINEYEQMDYYARLELMISTFGEVRSGFESIVNEYSAWDYIQKLLEILEKYIPLFSNDIEINTTRTTKLTFKDMGEIIPLLKKREASYSYLILMLKDLEKEAEKRLPKNIRLARFFDNLINHKEDIAKRCGIEEEVLFNVLNNMKEHTDAINDILNLSNTKK